MGEKLPNFLLWSGDKHTLLLLVQSGLELFLNLLSRFSVEEFALSSFKRDFCCPPTVFTLVDGAFATSAFCHKGTPFVACAQLSIEQTQSSYHIVRNFETKVLLERNRAKAIDGVIAR